MRTILVLLILVSLVYPLADTGMDHLEFWAMLIYCSFVKLQLGDSLPRQASLLQSGRNLAEISLR